MPFGLCNVLKTFQHLMNKVFEPFLGFFLEIFINNFGVYSDRASHLTKLELVFQHLEGLVVTLSPKKITIGFSEGKMVGHIVSKNGAATNFEKFDRISKRLTKKALEDFLGMVGYYQRFIHMFVAKAHALTRFFQEDAPTTMEDEVSKHAFEQF
jgi:hypothetical protein